MRRIAALRHLADELAKFAGVDLVTLRLLLRLVIDLLLGLLKALARVLARLILRVRRLRRLVVVLDAGGPASAARRLLSVARLRGLNLLLAVAIGLGAAPGLVSTSVSTIMDALARHHVVVLLLNMLF